LAKRVVRGRQYLRPGVHIAIHLGEKETHRRELTRMLLSSPIQELA
jgi:hypothetical protein